MPKLQLTKRNIQLWYSAAYSNAFVQAVWNAAIRRIDTDTPEGLDMASVSPLGGMKRARGDTAFETVKSAQWIIPLDQWTNGFILSRDVWNYNKVGLVRDKTDELARQAAAHPGQLFEETIVQLTSVTGPDGNPFIGTHDSQKNDLTKTEVGELDISGTVPTTAEAVEIMLALATKMRLYQDERGNYITRDADKFFFIVGQDMFKSFAKAVGQSTLESGETNPVAGAQKAFGVSWGGVILSPRVSSGQGYVVSGVGTPFVYEVLEEPNKPDVITPDSDQGVSMHYTGRVSVYGSYNVGVSPEWYRIARFTVG